MVGMISAAIFPLVARVGGVKGDGDACVKGSSTVVSEVGIEGRIVN